MRRKFRLFLIGSYGAFAVGTYAHCYAVLSRKNPVSEPFSRHFSTLAYATYFPIYWGRKLQAGERPNFFCWNLRNG